MELTASFRDLLPPFAPVFTAPTYQTFTVIVSGWVLSQRHRFITEVIFSGGQVGIGHWSRFHRFFSHAAWEIDTFSLALASKRSAEPSLARVVICSRSPRTGLWENHHDWIRTASRSENAAPVVAPAG
jgi:hypothetical protein